MNMQKNYISNVLQQPSAESSSSATLGMRLLLVLTGSLVVAACARFSVPLPFSPVPVSLSNFGVLLVGLTLGSRAGFAALVLYLMEGAAGLPVFSNGSLGLFGPTGGYLLAYPLAAFLTGYIAERGKRAFHRLLSASLAGEVLIFFFGIIWLVAMFHVPFRQAAHWGLYPFLVAELAKVLAASGIASRFARQPAA